MPLPELSTVIRVESIRLERCIEEALERELDHVLSGQSDHDSGMVKHSTAPLSTQVPVQPSIHGGDKPLTLQLEPQALVGSRSEYDRRRRAAKRLMQKALNPTVPRFSNSKKHTAIYPIRVSFDAKNLPAAKGAFVSRRQGTGTREYSLEELVTQGFKVVEWDGRTPTAIVDQEDRIITVLAGQPHGQDWNDVQMDMSAKLRQAASALRGLADKERRGSYVSLSVGVSYGGGPTAPGNLVHKPPNKAVADQLCQNGNFIRAAGFMSSCFAFYAPKLSADCDANINSLLKKHTELVKPFSNSTFPACTFNCGHRVITLEHVDSGNVPYGLCAVFSCGSYDPALGGHLILFDLKMAIQFPPGSTILIPSGTIRHGNVPIQADETRQSFTQFCPGGLLRWVAYGFQSVKAAAPDIKEHFLNTQEQRRDRAVGLFSKVNEVYGDRTVVYGLKSSR